MCPRIFLHLTKTAGGTLKKSLADCKELSVEFIYGGVNNFVAENDIEHLRKLDLIYGHMLFGLHIKIDTAPKYLCVMRHPTTRTVSHYYHLHRVEKNAKIGDKIRAAGDINDFFEKNYHWEFSNFLCKIISGLGNKPIPDDQLLSVAKSNVDNYFEFIGFQEYFSLSILRLQDVLGANLSINNSINIGKYDFSGISSKTLKSIENLNKMDMELYMYCLQKFL